MDSLKLVLKNAKHDTERVECWLKMGEFIYQQHPDSGFFFWSRAKDLAEANLKKTSLSVQVARHFKIQLSITLENLGVIYQEYKGDSNKALEYYEKGLFISEGVGDKHGIASALNNIGSIYKVVGQIDKALEYFGRCMKIREVIGDKKGLATTFSNLGLIYNLRGDTKTALEFHNKGLKIQEEVGDKLGMAVSLGNIGGVYKDKGDVVRALESLEKSSKLLEETNDKKGLAYLLQNIGVVHKYQGDIPKALMYYSNSLKILEEIGDKYGAAGALYNLGLIQYTQGDLAKALEYNHKSLKLLETVGDKEGMVNVLNGIGQIYKDQGVLDKAMDYFEKSLKFSEETGNKRGAAVALNNSGRIYREKGEFLKALDYFNRSLKIQTEIGNTKAASFTLANIGEVYLKQKGFASALKYAQKSMSISNGLGFPENIRTSSNLLFRIFQATGNYKLALENYELYIKMRDSINNIETQKATIKQQTKYEYDKQKAVADEKHAAEIKQQEEKAAAEKKRQNIVIASVSVVLLVVAVFSVILFNRFRVTQRQKAVIEQKEIETRAQKHIIEEKHKEITDSINYAERIQRSFLATQSHLNENLSEYFVLFKPKDVVSGDFYWSATLNNGNFALATADSTGHGVPGAIMSLLNITSLEKAIETETSPDKILNATRKIIIDRLKKDGSPEGGKDGMDCSLCVYDQKNMKLFVSAANNPVWIVRSASAVTSIADEGSVSRSDRDIIEVKADKMPVGKHDKQDIPFNQHEIQLQKGDMVYTLTDGFPDQFGGAKGKKFMSKNLRELLAKNTHLSMEEQKALLEKTFMDWAGDLEQVDDLTVIGIRV